MMPLAGLKTLSRYALNAAETPALSPQINNLRYGASSMVFQLDRVNQHVRLRFHNGLFLCRIFCDFRLRG